MNLALAFLGAGVLLLLAGSGIAIRGSIALLRAVHLGPAITAAAVPVCLAAPLASVALQSAMAHAPDLAAASIIGSVLANLLIVIGLAALIYPLPSPPRAVVLDGAALALGCIIVAAMGSTGRVQYADVVLLLIGFGFYAAAAFAVDWQSSRRQARAGDHGATGDGSIFGGLFLILAGIVAVALGGHFVVGGGMQLARLLNLSDIFTGLSIQGVAASMPVLAAISSSAYRGGTDRSVAPAMATSVVALLAVVALVSLCGSLMFSPTLARADLLVLVGVAIIIIPLMVANWTLSRPRGTLLIVMYLVYLALLANRQGLLPLHLIGHG